MGEPSEEAIGAAKYIRGWHGEGLDTNETAVAIQEFIDTRDRWQRWYQEAASTYATLKDKLMATEEVVKNLQKTVASQSARIEELTTGASSPPPEEKEAKRYAPDIINKAHVMLNGWDENIDDPDEVIEDICIALQAERGELADVTRQRDYWRGKYNSAHTALVTIKDRADLWFKED